MATTTYPHEPRVRRLWRKIQDDVMREATRVTVTTPGAAAFYRGMYPAAPAERVAVIENGFDPEIFASAGLHQEQVRSVQAGPLVLLHSGILYPRERDPRPFFTALKMLRDRGRIAPGELIVRLRASGFDDDFRAMASQIGVLDLIEFAPPAPYRDALREMGEASALLLLQACVCNEQIPAKAYEYLYAGRPILGLTDPAGDTGRLLARFSVDTVAPLEDAAQIAAMLERALPELRAGSMRVPPRQAVMTVSRRAGAQQLAELLSASVNEAR
jgi:glycosyltransferase involved in cell wall biosynthesis